MCVCVCVCVSVCIVCMCACLLCVHVMDKWRGGGLLLNRTITYIPFFLCNLVALQLTSYVDSQSKSFVEPILGPLCVCRSLEAKKLRSLQAW